MNDFETPPVRSLFTNRACPAMGSQREKTHKQQAGNCSGRSRCHRPVLGMTDVGVHFSHFQHMPPGRHVY